MTLYRATAEGNVPMTPEEEAEFEASRNPQKAPQQVQDEIVGAVQQRLDAFAQTRAYDGILSASTYAASTVPQFKAEGQYCIGARDATWAALDVILGQVLSGARPMPSGYADIAAELPALEWPA